MEMPAIPVGFDEITRQAERSIREFLAEAEKLDAKGQTFSAAQSRAWAFGAYMLWERSAPKSIAIPPYNALWLLIHPEDATSSAQAVTP